MIASGCLLALGRVHGSHMAQLAQHLGRTFELEKKGLGGGVGGVNGMCKLHDSTLGLGGPLLWLPLNTE